MEAIIYELMNKYLFWSMQIIKGNMSCRIYYVTFAFFFPLNLVIILKKVLFLDLLKIYFYT